MAVSSRNTILHIADDPLLNLGLERFLQLSGFDTIAVTTLAAALDLPRSVPPDGVILDWTTSGPRSNDIFGDLSSLLRSYIFQIKEHWPISGLVVRLDYSTLIESWLSDIFSNGYRGISFISPRGSLDDLRHAIEHAINGSIYFEAYPTWAVVGSNEPFLREFPNDLYNATRYVIDRLPLLSPREMEVAAQLCKQTSRISLEIGLSSRTVSHYIDSIYAKVGLKEPPQAFQHYRRATLIVLAILASRHPSHHRVTQPLKKSSQNLNRNESSLRIHPSD